MAMADGSATGTTGGAAKKRGSRRGGVSITRVLLTYSLILSSPLLTHSFTHSSVLSCLRVLKRRKCLDSNV